MNLKKKSNILVSIFVLFLILNTFGLFYSMHKIEEANNHLISESKITKLFLEFKFILKDLQEISTDASLVGDKDGVNELENVKGDYLKLYKEISRKKITENESQFLNLIDNHFNQYYNSLVSMAKSGITRVDARKSSISEMDRFDAAVTSLENSLEDLKSLTPYELLSLKYKILSIQEILTDALAVGETRGFADVDLIMNEIENDINILSKKYKLETEKLTQLKINIIQMKDNGKTMAIHGKTIKDMIINTSSEMKIVDKNYEEISKAIDEIVKIQDKSLLESIKEDKSVISTFKMVSLLLTITFILAVIFLFLMMKNILSNIVKLDNAVANLLNSEHAEKVRIDSNDEIGNISKNFNTYIESLTKGIEQDREVIDEARNIIQKVNVGLFNDRIKAKASSREIDMLISEINGMIENTQNNLTILSDALIALSTAKYDYKIPRIDGVTGLMASLLSGTKVAQSTINDVMALIDNSNKRLTFSAEDLSKSSRELSDSANDQAAALEETAAAIEEVTSTINHSSESAAQMSLYAKEVTNSSLSGIELAKKTSVSMDELSSEVNTINEAISVIDQIAFQTNILSLNAAVEAATAGEAGKGFAVVAQEVRNLASRSAEAAKEIKELVVSATTKANEGKNVASEMINGFNVLNENINKTITLIDDVTNATREQKSAMVQISDTVNSLDQATQINASLASDISEMAEVTKDLALGLQAAVNKTTFDLDAKRRVCNTEMIFDLNSLKCDHIMFKNNNFKQCAHGSRFTVKNHHECNLGKWIDAHKDEDFANSESWNNLVDAHKKVHGMVQDTVDLYADNYKNGQIISVTENLEIYVNEVFKYLDEIRELNCDLEFKKRGA